MAYLMSWIFWVLRGCGLRFFFFFQAEDGIRALYVTGVQTCALPIYLVEHQAVRAPVHAYGWQPGRAPDQQPADHRSGRDEGAAPDHRGHRLLRRTMASASRIISGSATAPTVICDSATSGAWRTRNARPSNRPKKLAMIAWLTGSRTSTTAVPAAATSSSTAASRTVTASPPPGSRIAQLGHRRSTSISTTSSSSLPCTVQAPKRRMRAALAMAWVSTGLVISSASVIRIVLSPYWTIDSRSSTAPAMAKAPRVLAGAV